MLTTLPSIGGGNGLQLPSQETELESAAGNARWHSNARLANRPHRPRQQYQFSLAWLFRVTTLIALACGLVASIDVDLREALLSGIFFLALLFVVVPLWLFVALLPLLIFVAFTLSARLSYLGLRRALQSRHPARCSDSPWAGKIRTTPP
jgi:hypothetical protein